MLATGSGSPPVFQVWTAKPGRLGSRPVPKPNLLNLGGPNLDPYPSTCLFRRVWLDPSVPISGFAFRVSHLWLHCYMLLLIVNYWHWYVMVHFRRTSRLDVQNKFTHTPNHMLKLSFNRVSTRFGLASSVIWVVLDHYHQWRRIWQPL